MLILFRRHKKSCRHKKKGRSYRNCQCPIWIDGTLGGKRVRESLNMRDWQRANEKMVRWEAEGNISEDSRKTIEDAWRDFLITADARKLSHETIRKYKHLRKQMIAFAEGAGLRFLSQMDLETLDTFRATWKDGARSSAKKLERVKAFFRFATERKWIPESPAHELKAAKITLAPTMPYTREEMKTILASCKNYVNTVKAQGKENARRLRALVLLLRYSGLRIGDAVTLPCDRLKGNRLFLYTQKTNVPVNLILPPVVLRALADTRKASANHWFWTGVGKKESCSKEWQDRLSKMFATTKITHGHAHRFRDTFAVELLLAGVPMEQVSILLGHQSIRITERHYSPWVISRQTQLEDSLKSAWAKDSYASRSV
jgi:site-specific recombinase XerD